MPLLCLLFKCKGFPFKHIVFSNISGMFEKSIFSGASTVIHYLMHCLINGFTAQTYFEVFIEPILYYSFCECPLHLGMRQAKCSVEKSSLIYLYLHDVYRDVLLSWLDMHKDRQYISVQYPSHHLQTIGVIQILVVQPTNEEADAQL